MADDPVPGPSLGIVSIDLAQESFQRAYVLSVAAAARCSWSDRLPDYDGVDVTLNQQVFSGQDPHFASLDLQLKSTRSADAIKDDHVAYSLSRAHYDKLRTENVLVPRLLVVIVVPPEIQDWLDQDEERLQLFKCAYWLSLTGKPPIETQSVTVHLPRQNVFDVEALCHLMYRARAGLDLGA